MRNLTHYELSVLIKNVLSGINYHYTEHITNGDAIHYGFLAARCNEIVQYINEYNSLEEEAT